MPDAPAAPVRLHSERRFYHHTNFGIAYNSFAKAEPPAVLRGLPLSAYSFHGWSEFHEAWHAAGLEPVTLEGKRSRRLAKQLKQRGFELGSHHLTMLGELTFGVFLRYIRPPFIWKAGEYGDGGSCFMEVDGARVSARYMMEHYPEHFGAVLVENRQRKGIGRCWFLTNPSDPSKMLVFNAYGISMSVLCDIVWPGQWQHVWPTYQLSCDGTMWFNGDSRLIDFDRTDIKPIDLKNVPRVPEELRIRIENWGIHHHACRRCQSPMTPDFYCGSIDKTKGNRDVAFLCRACYVTFGFDA